MIRPPALASSCLFSTNSLLPLSLVVAALLLSACGTRQPAQHGSGIDASGYSVGGGDYRKDGPHANPPANLASVPDAVPRIEPLASGPNRPYVVMGKRYVPDTSGGPYRARGKASWYGRQFHGRPTSNGETYNMYAMTAAHPTLPIPSYARVTRADNGRSIIVRINDRGPFIAGRVIDLSYVAAYKLGTLQHGTGEVIVERIMPNEIRRGVPAPAPEPVMVASVQKAQPASAATNKDTEQLEALIARARATPGDAIPSVDEDDVIARFAQVQARAPVRSIPVPEAPAASITPASAPRFNQTLAPTVQRMAVSTMAGAVLPTRHSPPSANPVFLQLGAFGQAENAHALANRLRAELSEAGMPSVVNRGDSIYRVQLGPFHDHTNAVAMVETIYLQTGIRPHVVTP